MEGWENVSLQEIVSFRTGKLDSNAAIEGGEYPFFTCAPETFRINAYAFDTTAILLAGNNATGVFPIKYYSGKFNCYQRTYVIETINSDVASIRYLYYSIQLQLSFLQSMSIGAATKFLTKRILNHLKIPLPPLPIQKKIAGVLAAYDDLIENNLRRIRLLEELAQITYEQWFVRLRFPGHETVKFIDGIPEGWTNKPLSEFLHIKHGYAFKGEYFTTVKTPNILLTPGNFQVGGGMKLSKVKYYSETGPVNQDYVLSQNDLLITMTDLSKTSDTLGFPLLIPNDKKMNFLHNQRLGMVSLLNSTATLPRYFLYSLFQDPRYRGYVVGSATGLSVKHTSPSKILSYRPYLPNLLQSELIDKFDSFAGGLWSTIHNINQSNDLLREARDILLPRLMTGMIDIENYQPADFLKESA